MNYATPEAIEAARRIDLYSYLHEREPQELVKCGNGVYCTRTHDSLKISRGKWFWWSHGIGGHTALDYLIRVRGMRLPDAVEILAGITCAVLPPPRAAPPPPEKRLLQLPHNDSCDRVRRYLTGRGLDAEIVDRMIAEGRIAEEKDHGFALFYGFDEQGKPRQCSARATDGTAVKRDVAGSDRRFGFCLEAEVSCRKVWVFESAIDLLSFATLMKQAGNDYRREHLLSLSGVYKPPEDIRQAKVPMALSHFLVKHPDVMQVDLCLDNDSTGRAAAIGIRAALGESAKIVRTHLPPAGKDYNDYLRLKLQRKVDLERRICDER